MGTDSGPFIDVERLVAWQDEVVEAWHRVPERSERELKSGSPPIASRIPDLEQAIFREHLANFRLWHEEDEARRPDASDEAIAGVKRRIDVLNQSRNDTIEEIDAGILDALIREEALREDAPLHSETPGAIIDRLSILALKRYHMAEETHREGALPAHRESCRERLAILDRQRFDLAGCLVELMADLEAGRRSFRRYRQFKMYNDPEMNPVWRESMMPPEEIR